jgi:hypothetical protein
MWHFKENEEKYGDGDDDVCVLAAGFKFVTSHVAEDKKQETPLGEAGTE